MTKEVLLSMSSLQNMGEESDTIEVIVSADYYLKNDKHYILYDEVIEGFEGKVHNILKIDKDIVSIKKTGITGTHMVFSKSEKHSTCYSTPMGDLMMGISTNQIIIEEAENQIKVEIGYNLEINQEQLSECSIIINVKAKGKKRCYTEHN